MKYFDFKRYKFSTIFKKINFKRYNFSKFFKFTDFESLNFKKFYKYLVIRRVEFTKFTQLLNLKRYNIARILNTSFFKSKFWLFHLPGALVFFGFLYLFIPTFYNYDKSSIENLICKNKNIECVVRGKISYNFYPSPKIKIKDLIINDLSDKKKTLITAEIAVVKLSFKNLLAKEKHKFKKLKLKNYQIDIDLKNSKKYTKFFVEKINYIPVQLSNGQITFYDGKEYVATIGDANSDLLLEGNDKEIELKGKFLNDTIFVSITNKKIEDKLSSDILLKMTNLNFLTKANIINYEKNKNTLTGNILVKKDKHRLTSIFNYKDNEIIINNSNVQNIFFNGKLDGKIRILPYFSFDLDLALNSINFTKLYNYFLFLDEKKQRNFFRISKKINGKLGLSSEKIYSSYNLVKSFESQIKFINGDILIDQFLFNLGKLGAADLSGSISNEKKFTSFKYESNIFVDNEKKFINKFGIYNRKSIPTSFFISGNFDLQNIRSSFYEISDNDKLHSDDVNFIEKEFNNIMLDDNYENLFRFPKFKEFIKTITADVD
tara:strand:- start:1549 stop:3186 length:1638 start_codon:yes stop_codon:yes gene_type:complete